MDKTACDHSQESGAHLATAERPDGARRERCIAELTWSVLPAALQRALGDRFSVWISAEQQSFFGISILEQQTDIDDEMSDDVGHGPTHRLCAWALVRGSNSIEQTEYIRQPLFDCVNTGERRSRATPAAPPFASSVEERHPLRFEILNSRPDRLSVDISDSAEESICRLSYLLQPDGRPIWWADSILPRLLGLEGGRYELVDVAVYDLGNEPG